MGFVFRLKSCQVHGAQLTRWSLERSVPLLAFSLVTAKTAIIILIPIFLLPKLSPESFDDFVDSVFFSKEVSPYNQQTGSFL